MVFFFPIGHDEPIRRFPYATITIIILCSLAFPLTYYPGMKQNKRLEELLDARMRIENYIFAKYTLESAPSGPGRAYRTDLEGFWKAYEEGKIVSPSDPDFKGWQRLNEDIMTSRESNPFHILGFTPSDPRPWTFITHMFLHGGYIHLLFNMIFLWLVGCNIEYRWGIPAFCVSYLSWGIIGALAQGASNWNETTPMIGASGAIAGVMGAFMVRHYNARINILYVFLAGLTTFRHGTFKIPAWAAIGLWAAGQLWLAPVALYLGSKILPIGVFAHLGGFGAGVLTALIIRKTSLEKKILGPTDETQGGYLPPPEQAELDSALRFLEAGKAFQAHCFLKKLREKDRNNLFVLRKLIEAQVGLGVREEAQQAIAELIEASKAEESKRKLVLDPFRSALDAFPGMAIRPELQMLAARWLEESGDFLHAGAAYMNMAQSSPQHPLSPKALLKSGEIKMERLGKFAEGMEDLKRLIETYPQSPLCDFAMRKIKR